MGFMDEKHFTVAEVAESLKVSAATVTVWIERDELLAFDVAGPGAKIHQWRIPESAIVAFLDSRKNGATRSQPVPARRPKMRPTENFF
jgi:hypothetical protein